MKIHLIIFINKDILSKLTYMRIVLLLQINNIYFLSREIEFIVAVSAVKKWLLPRFIKLNCL
mgnify:CR=1 FL=1